MPAIPHNPEPDPQVPDSLRDGLRTAYRWPGQPAAAIDEAVLLLARERAAAIRRRRGVVRFMGRAAAVAAAAGLALAAVIIPRLGTRPPMPGPIAAGPWSIVGDANGDGKLDILDALVLARRLGSDPATAPAVADLNADGVVDLRDVDAIARASVMLEGRG